MSANTFFDIIEDTIIAELEAGATLPDPLTVVLEPEQFRALMVAGLSSEGGQGEPLSHDLTNVMIKVAGRTVLLRSSEDPVLEELS